MIIIKAMKLATIAKSSEVIAPQHNVLSSVRTEPVTIYYVSLLITQTFFHFIYLVSLHVGKWEGADIKEGDTVHHLVAENPLSTSAEVTVTSLCAHLTSAAIKAQRRKSSLLCVFVFTYCRCCTALRSLSAESECCTLTNTSPPRVDWMCSRWRESISWIQQQRADVSTGLMLLHIKLFGRTHFNINLADGFLVDSSIMYWNWLAVFIISRRKLFAGHNTIFYLKIKKIYRIIAFHMACGKKWKNTWSFLYIKEGNSLKICPFQAFVVIRKSFWNVITVRFNFISHFELIWNNCLMNVNCEC